MDSVSTTIGTSVLAIPKQSETPEGAFDYVKRVVECKKILDEPWISVFVSSGAVEALWCDDVYPLRRQLQDMLNSHRIIDFDAQTLFVVIDKVLSKMDGCHLCFGASEVNVRECITEPDILTVFDEGSALRSDLEQCITLHGIVRRYCGIENHPLMLVNTESAKVRVKSVLRKVVCEGQELFHLPRLPLQLDGDASIYHDFEGLLECLDPTVMLCEADCDLIVKVAIKVGVFKKRLLDSDRVEWESLPQFQVGAGFRKSVVDLNPTATVCGKILRAAVAAIEREELSKVHVLRRSASGSDVAVQRSGDNAKAWRRDVDLNLHLHYWQRSDSMIEFANVAYPHDNYSILE